MERKLHERVHFTTNAVKGNFLILNVLVDMKTEIAIGKENSEI